MSLSADFTRVSADSTDRTNHYIHASDRSSGAAFLPWNGRGGRNAAGRAGDLCIEALLVD